jgi:hypothetical protein
MRDIVVIGGFFSWLIFGLVWITPLKRKLIKLHGSDKTSKFFIELARQGDPAAKTVVFRTKVFMGIGIAGAFLGSLIKYVNP